MTYKRFTLLSIILLLILFIILSLPVFIVDPIFHYHKPLPFLHYQQQESRYQNFGIAKYFDYDSLIIGTSMTANFKTSQFDSLFNSNSIKLINYGATIKENSDCLDFALHNHKIKNVLWGIDLDTVLKEKNQRSEYDYPDYLLTPSLFDDFGYLFSIDFWKSSLYLIKNNSKFNEKGTLSFNFDDYQSWNDGKYGKENILTLTPRFNKIESNTDVLSQNSIDIILENINQNIISLVKQFPDTEFTIFIPPYSLYRFDMENQSGRLNSYLQIKDLLLTSLVAYKNVKLFSFFSDESIICNLDNYKDYGHYGNWINDQILNYIKDEKYIISTNNIDSMINKENSFLKNYPFDLLFDN